MEEIIEEDGIKYTVKTSDDGNIRWYKEGTDILHRENGPAIEYADGAKFWFKEGKVHREDGPTLEYSDGFKEYWINDKYLSNIKTDEDLMIKLLLE